MNKGMIIAAALISGLITTQTAASANSLAPSAGGPAPVKSGVLNGSAHGYAVTQTGEGSRGVNQNFTSDPNYAPRNTYESRIDGSAGESGADNAGNDNADSGAVGRD